jgi:hypothetical protein
MQDFFSVSCRHTLDSLHLETRDFSDTPATSNEQCSDGVLDHLTPEIVLLLSDSAFIWAHGYMYNETSMENGFFTIGRKISAFSSGSSRRSSLV